MEEPTTSQIYYESVVKEELIIEDELPPEPHYEDTIMSISGFEQTIQNEPTDHGELGKPETVPKPALRCGKCKKIFHRTELYKIHCKKHETVEEKHFLCKPCRRPFATKHGLFVHRRLKHGGDQLEGSKKPHNSLMKNTLQKHVTFKKYGNELRILEEDDVYKCSACFKKFSQRYLIERHIRRHYVAKYLNQQVLDLTEKNVAGSKPLQVQEDGQDMFKCPLCSRLYPNKNSCAAHIRLHVAVAKKLVQCETCGLFVGSHKELEEHEFSKHGKIKAKPSEDFEPDEKGHFKCNECPKTFGNRHGLLRHIRRRKAIDEGQFQCKICGKCLGSNKTLSRHSLKFHNEIQRIITDPLQMEGSDRFKCPRCPATFARRKICNQHIRRHRVMDEAVFQCKACLRSFRDKDLLKVHERDATRNLTKSHCFKNQKRHEFEAKQSENPDTKYHVVEGNGVFACSGCKNVFLLRRNCIAHIRRQHVYIDKNKYKCHTCGTNFGCNNALKSHALKEHGEKLTVETRVYTRLTLERDENGRFLCSECPRKYENRHSFIEHIRRHKILRSAKYQCGVCQKCFLYNHELIRHGTTHKSKSTLTIEEEKANKDLHGVDQLEGSKDPQDSSREQNAPRKYVALKKYRNELRILEEDEVFKCSACFKKFSQRYLIERHIRRHRLAMNLNQQVLDLTEKNVAGSKPLQVQEDGQDMFKCPLCSRLYPNKNSCAAHIRMHVAVAKKLVQCEACGLFVGSHKELEEHEFSKHGKIKAEPSEAFETDEKNHFKCDECPKTFTSRDGLNRHIRRRKAIDVGQFQCKICGLCLGCNSALSRHSLESHNENQRVIVDPLQMKGSDRFKCPRCPATFVRRKMCNQHIRRHRVMDEAFYQCKSCLRTFGGKQILENHEREATRNLTKSQCFKNQKKLEFENKQSENTDKKYHVVEGDGVFACSGCKNVFLQRHHCVAHIRGHVAMDEGKHKCPTCEKNFSCNRALKHHALKTHGETLTIETRGKYARLTLERDENGRTKA